MNPTQSKLSGRIERQAQRLDTKVRNVGISDTENERAERALAALGHRLQAIIPDVAAAAEENVERLARYAPDATPNPQFMVCDYEKLARLHHRLEELVPGADLTPEQRIDRLEAWFREVHPEKIAV